MSIAPFHTFLSNVQAAPFFRRQKQIWSKNCNSLVENRAWQSFAYLNIIWYKYSFVSYSCNHLDTNIFWYSFVLFFWYKFIQIFICIVFYTNIFMRQKLEKSELAQIVHTKINIQRNFSFPLLCYIVVLIVCFIRNLKSNI